MSFTPPKGYCRVIRVDEDINALAAESHISEDVGYLGRAIDRPFFRELDDGQGAWYCFRLTPAKGYTEIPWAWYWGSACFFEHTQLVVDKESKPEFIYVKRMSPIESRPKP